MADESDIEIEDDAPIVIDVGDDEDDALAKAVEQEGEKPELDAGTKALTEQLEAAKQALALEASGRHEAETRAAEALQYAQQREREIWESSRRETQTQADMAQTGLFGAQEALRVAQQDYEKAFEAGDAKAQGDANARMSYATNKIVAWEERAATIAQSEAQMRQQPQRQQPTQQRPPTAEEVLARNEQNPNLLPREKEWLRNHQDATLDQRKNLRLKVAFDDAMDKGIPRGSDAYFQHLDKFMEYDNGGGSRQTAGSRVSAPVSRGGSGPTARPQSVKLTERDIEIANSMGIKSPEQLKEYARNKLKVPDRMKELNGGMTK